MVDSTRTITKREWLGQLRPVLLWSICCRGGVITWKKQDRLGTRAIMLCPLAATSLRALFLEILSLRVNKPRSNQNGMPGESIILDFRFVPCFFALVPWVEPSPKNFDPSCCHSNQSGYIWSAGGIIFEESSGLILVHCWILCFLALQILLRIFYTLLHKCRMHSEFFADLDFPWIGIGIHSLIMGY